MNANPFKVPGNWYRGNLHSHTTESDGWLSPRDLVEAYKRDGYHFLALTDHGKVVDIDGLGGTDFLVLAGAEYGARGARVGAYHVVGIDLKDGVKETKDQSPVDLIHAIESHGGYPIVAHPYWSGLTTQDMLALEGCPAMEVFNSGCEVEVGRGISGVHWDDMLSCGQRITAVASDDAHHPTRGGFLSGWTMVKAPELTREAIMRSLREGLCYSSMGPVLHDLEVADGKVRVRCSPVRTVALLSNPGGKGNYAAAPPGESLTEAEFAVPGGTYFRVQVTDELGQIAWSNPIFPDGK